MKKTKIWKLNKKRTLICLKVLVRLNVKVVAKDKTIPERKKIRQNA